MEDDRYAADEIVAVIRDAVRKAPIPNSEYRRICQRIEPERKVVNAPRFDQPLTDSWEILTTPLRLAGAPAMRPSAAGSFPALDALAAGMPWGKSLIGDVARQLRIQLALGRPWVKLEPMLLIGDPGVGKTWLARQLAATLQVEFAALELGNTSDDRLLSGTARGWTNTVPA